MCVTMHSEDGATAGQHLNLEAASAEWRQATRAGLRITDEVAVHDGSRSIRRDCYGIDGSTGSPGEG